MKTAFVFPGQGSQFVGMAKDLAAEFPAAKSMYSVAAEVLGYDLGRISFEGPEEELKQTWVTQPAIFVHSCVVLEILRSRGEVRFDMVAGHSLGEYSALMAAGVMTFEEALRVVKVRSSAMQEAGETHPGTMAAVIGMEADKLEEICRQASASGIVQCANFNSPGQIVISGSVAGVRSAMNLAKAAGARMVKELVVSGAFHSPLMASAGEKVRNILKEVTLRDAAVPVYPNVTARAERGSAELSSLLVDQITAPVRWQESVQNMIGDGATRFFEIGPGNVLSGLVKRIDKNVSCECIGKVEELTRYA